MWIMTTGGFVSAVAHRDDKSFLMVRGRDKKSLENMIESIQMGLEKAGQPKLDPAPEIQSQGAGQHWDYPHRVIVSKVHFQYFLLEEVDDFLDYANFKSEATVARGNAYHDALMKVWTDMRALTEPEYRPVYSPKTSYKPYDTWSPGKYSATAGSEDSGLPIGTRYEWDDDGKISSQTSMFRPASDIHSLPLDVDPTADDPEDDIIDVDEEGAPIHARASSIVDLGELSDDEIAELDAVLLHAGFHIDDERQDGIYDDGIYRVGGLTADEQRIDDEADARFKAWLAREAVKAAMNARDAGEDTGAFREPVTAAIIDGSPIEVVEGVAYYTETGEPVRPPAEDVDDLPAAAPVAAAAPSEPTRG